MTVQELIDKLSEIKDKNLPVHTEIEGETYIYTPCGMKIASVDDDEGNSFNALLISCELE